MRALLHRPSVLLMDEATRGPGPRSRARTCCAPCMRRAGARRLRAVGDALGGRGARRRPRAGAAQGRAAGRRHAGRGDAGARRSRRWRRASSPARAESPIRNATSSRGDIDVIEHCQGRERVPPRSALPLLGRGLGTAAPAQGTAYVSSEKDQAITLIDLATLSVKGTIPTCKRGRHIQLTPDRLIMLACSDSNAADVIDPATRQVAAPHSARRRARGLRPVAGRQDHLRVQRGRRRGQLHRCGERQDAQVDQGRQGARRREGQRRRQDAVRDLRGREPRARDRRRQRHHGQERQGRQAAAPHGLHARRQGAVGHQRARRQRQHHRHRHAQRRRRA